MTLLSLVAELVLDSAGFKSGLKDAERTSENTGGKLEKTFNRIGTAIKAAFSAIAIKKAANAFWGLLNDVATFGDTIDKQSQALGMSRRAYQEWDYILRQNGASIDAMGVSMKTMNAQILSGSEESKKAFKELGVDMGMLAAMPMENQFDYLIQAFNRMPAGAQKSALAVQIFGRNGMELMPLLNQTTESINGLRDEANELGLIMSDEDVDASVAFGDALDALKSTFRAVRNEVGARFLPVFTRVFRRVLDIAKDLRKAYNKDGISGVFKELPESIKKAVLGGDYSKGESTWKDVGEKLFGWIKKGFEGKNLIDEIINFASAKITGIIDFIGNIVSSFSTWLSSGENVTKLIGIISNILVKSVENLGTILTTLLPTLIEAFTDPTFISGLTEVVKQMATALATVLSDPDVQDALLQMAVSLGEAIWKVLESVFERLGTWLRDNIVAPIMDFFGIKRNWKTTEELANGQGVGRDDVRRRRAQSPELKQLEIASGEKTPTSSTTPQAQAAQWYEQQGKPIPYVAAQKELDAMLQRGEINGKQHIDAYNIASIVGEWDGTMDELIQAATQYGAAMDEFADSPELAIDAFGNMAVSAEAFAARINSISLPTVIGGESDGSHASGLWTVPYDDYMAKLHRGERVLTASQARHGYGTSDTTVEITRSIKQAMFDLMGSMNLVLNGKTFGRVAGDSVSKRVGTNINLAQKRTAFGHGG